MQQKECVRLTHLADSSRAAGEGGIGLARTKVDTPDWVIHLDEAVTRVSRAARSPRLHQMMGRRARVELGDHLHLTLALLGAGQPMRVSELAEQLDVERSTVSRRVSQLIDQGLVVRSVDEKDHRAALLSLTLPGRRALARIQDAWRQTLLELTGGWRDRDRAETTSRLSRLADGLETLLAG
jgi:DNA-binding MarR family transcriptional regulator